MPLKFKSTADLKVSKKIVDQVIGQEDAVAVIKKASDQRRHVLLIGEPGTGKSMLGLALAELLPKENLLDILSFPNPNDENQPLIRTVPGGQGRELMAKSRAQSMSLFKNQNIILFILIIIAFIAPWWMFSFYGNKYGFTVGAIIFAASLIGAMVFLASFIIFLNIGKRMSDQRTMSPKVIVDNFQKKQAPFFDATGAHAGALLGDVLHDPFQSLLGIDKVTIVSHNNLIEKSLHWTLDMYWHKTYKYNGTKKSRNYEAVFIPKNEIILLGEKKGSVAPVEVLSANRYDYDGKMVKISTSESNEIIVTPEHKIAIEKNGRIVYVEAGYLKQGDKVLSRSEDIIIDEQDIINTYDGRQQAQCRLYYQYLEIKEKNPSWGYKRIAKSMNQPIGKTRWWHAGKHIPVPIQTANWLKQKGLLPLRIDDPKLPLIAKVLGASFGDGGIFENLNGLFLSSSEKEAVSEFQEDLENIFGLNPKENSRIIEGGEYGHSWCCQNTNRNIIRFFLALGSPKGKKTRKEFNIPSWIRIKTELEDEFFGSFFGSEMGIPKVHVKKNHLNTFDIAITGTKDNFENRIDFFNEIKNYLEDKQIKCNKIMTKRIGDRNFLFRLMISTEFISLAHFISLCKINYCLYKKEKIKKSINELSGLKREKYHELLQRGYGAEHTMKLLKLDPASLYIILNYETIGETV